MESSEKGTEVSASVELAAAEAEERGREKKGVAWDEGAQKKGDGSERALHTLKSASGFVLSQKLTVPAHKTLREMHNCANRVNWNQF